MSAIVSVSARRQSPQPQQLPPALTPRGSYAARSPMAPYPPMAWSPQRAPEKVSYPTMTQSPSSRGLGPPTMVRTSSRDAVRRKGVNATSWAPPPAARMASARERGQEGLVRDTHAQSFVHLPTTPLLPRSHSALASQCQLAGACQPTQRILVPQAAASVPAPLPIHLSRKPTANMDGLRAASKAVSMPSSDFDDADYSEPREDLEGLLDYFQGLAERGVRLTEVTYVVNTWTLGGVIPLWHHGFILQAEDEGFLTLDFSRRGILWDTFDTYPDLPESTIFVKKYSIDTDPERMKSYCKETKPFSWHSNDCQHWAQGVMRVMRIMENPLEDRGGYRKPDSLECFFCGGARNMEKRVLPTCLQ